jgi:cytochrome c oxidase subunit 1
VTRPYRLASAHFAVAIAAFGLAACLAVLQGLSVADINFPMRGEALYYMSVTAHGVLMALVFTTFFIMGLGYLFSRATLSRIVGERIAWVAFAVAVFGTVMVVITILSGEASVLYTFYPPLQAHPAFYIGATLLVVGSWIWGGVMIASYRAWRREHPGTPAPLAMHGILATVIVWFLATAGLAVEVLGMLIPWSLGLVETIDPVLARTFFWWFGHPLVYFWLLPAYVLWYTVMPRVAGGRLFSDPLARMVFVLFILFSTPVGFHHQFMDPGISSGWKLFHTFTTYVILYPSFVTAFTVIASMEIAGRMKGAKGVFDWIGKLPWGDPFFASVALAMVAFAFGGFGGAINAAYAMNALVHNTSFIQGHFHLTLGTTAALSFMGATYHFLPKISGRELRFATLAKIQPYLWFVGMAIFSTSYHIAGIEGLPRRVYSASFLGEEIAERWAPLTKLGAVGGVVLFISALCFVLVAAGTWLGGRRSETSPLIELASPLEPVEGPGIWDRLGMWSAVAVVLVLAAYAYPIWHLLSQQRFGSPGFAPF